MPFWVRKGLADDQKANLSHPERPRSAPGRPQMRPREPRRRAGLHILQRIAHFPPGPACTTGTDQPRPPAPGRLLLHNIFYLFLSTSYLLTCAFLLTHTPLPFGVGGFERAAPSAADPEKKTTSHSNSNFNQVRMKIPSFSTHRFQI